MRKRSHPTAGDNAPALLTIANNSVKLNEILPAWVWKTQSPRCRYYVQCPRVVGPVEPSSWKTAPFADQNLFSWFCTVWSATRLQTASADRLVPLIGHLPIGQTMALDSTWWIALSGNTLAFGRRTTAFEGGGSGDRLL